MRKKRGVIRIDPSTGRINKYYSSIADASRDSFISISAIWCALNGRAKTAGGYKWKYRSDVLITIIR